MRPIHTLVWHCTATPEGREFTRAEIDAMHRARGFAKIGYHRLVHLDGSVSIGRLDSDVGAHVAGHNTGTLGFSYVGGLNAAGKPADTRTPAQKATMERLTRETLAAYPAIKAVVGHRDLSPDSDGDGQVEPHEWVKICPCFDAIPEYRHLLGRGGAQKPTVQQRVGLGLGDKGPDVERLQRNLAALGIEPGKIDGDFGPKTEAAVIIFQQRHVPPKRGTVDPITAAALVQAVANLET
jgi:N-acetylmuramoyl-L-alanine amidase